MTLSKLAVTGLIAAVALLAVAACGDDDDDRLTEEEYLAEVDRVQADVSSAFEQEIFGAESAREGLEGLADLADRVVEGLNDLEPPEELDELHGQYIEAVEGIRTFAEDEAGEVDEDAPVEDLEAILFGGGDPFEEVSGVECQLTDLAEQRGIELEFLTCDQAEGPEAAGDNPVAVEAVEFAFNLDGEFGSDTTGFTLANAGEQPHEAFIVRIPEDADVDELLASEDEPEGIVDIGGTFAEPGQEVGFGFEEPLEPGRYLMVCFVEDPDSGQPHAQLGMVEEFTIE